MRRLLIAAAVVLVLACVLALSVARAAGHYDRGRQAFADGDYGRAATEFAAAEVLTVSYKDADWLHRAAEQQLVARPTDGMLAPLLWPENYRHLLAQALRDLREARYFSAAAAIGALRSTYPTYPVDLGRHAARAAAQGGDRLLAQARELLLETRWSAVRLYVDAALILQPGWAQAVELSRRARLFASVAPLYVEAQELARSGSWAKAADALRRVVAAAPGYPGAYQLLGTARTKVAAKERRARNAATASSTASPAPTSAPTASPTPKPTSTLPPPP